MDDEKCIVNLSKFYLGFTVEESCGKCTPCRVGTKRMLEKLEKITEGEGEKEDIEKLEKLAFMIKKASVCGLGMTAPNPILSTLKYFKDEYIAHIEDKNCPAGECKALAYIKIDKEKCIGCGICAKICPVDAISGQIKSPFEIDPKICIKCRACIGKCPVKAIS